MHRRLWICAAAAIALSVMSDRVLADTPDPVFWTFNLPLPAEDFDHEHIIMMIKPKVVDLTSPKPWPARTPEEVAIEVARRINGIGYPCVHEEGEICILLQYFGQGDGQPYYGEANTDEGNLNENAPALFRHWCDGLKDDQNPAMNPSPHFLIECPEETDDLGVDKWWITPWFNEGIAESGAWLDEFISWYKVFQDPDHPDNPDKYALPDPTRFHFDTENDVKPVGNEKEYAELPIDSRWSDDYRGRVAGFPADLDTMSELYDQAAEDDQWKVGGKYVKDFNPDFKWCDESNLAWTNWYNHVCYTALDAAMKEACYDRIHADSTGWDDAVLCSNYLTSCRVDPQYTYRWVFGSSSDGWWHHHWRGSADLQAPVFYIVDSHHQRDGESRWAATMRVHRENLHALVHSLDDDDSPDEIVPWISNVGESYDDQLMEPGMAREMLVMLRSRGLREIILFNGDYSNTEENWAAMADVVDQVWTYDLRDAVVLTGTTNDDVETLLLADDRRTLDIEAKVIDPFTTLAVAEVTFGDNPAYDEADPPDDGSIRILIEGNIDSDNTASVGFKVEIWNNHAYPGSWRAVLADGAIGRTSEVFYLLGQDDGDPDESDYISDDGQVRLRITARHISTLATPFTLKLDVVAIAGEDR